MREKVMERVRKIYGKGIPEKVFYRLDYEFKILKEYNLENDLTILSEIINEWRKKGYFVNGTGCLKESFLAYLLGIIDVNPMCLNKLLNLNFSKRIFEIIVPKEIEKEFDNDLKGKGIDIQINYINHFAAHLLSALEYECGISTRNISFDENKVSEKFIKRCVIGNTLTTADSLEIKYGLVFPFGMNNENLKTFYDYVNYDKDHNDEYSMNLVMFYYITYFRVYFPNVFYPIYIDCLIKSLALDPYYKEEHKMQFLKRQIVDIYNSNYKLSNI